MADFHLLREWRFAERAAERLVIEERVVAEAVGSARPIDDVPFYYPPKGLHQGAVLHQSYHAHEPRPPVPITSIDALQASEQQRVVLLVRGVRPGVARRVNPWRAAQRVHFQPAILGEQKSFFEPPIVF